MNFFKLKSMVLVCQGTSSVSEIVLCSRWVVLVIGGVDSLRGLIFIVAKKQERIGFSLNQSFHFSLCFVRVFVDGSISFSRRSDICIMSLLILVQLVTLFRQASFETSITSTRSDSFLKLWQWQLEYRHVVDLKASNTNISFVLISEWTWTWFTAQPDFFMVPLRLFAYVIKNPKLWFLLKRKWMVWNLLRRSLL